MTSIQQTPVVQQSPGIQLTRARLLTVGMVAAPVLVIIAGFLFPSGATLHDTFVNIAAMGGGYLLVSFVLGLGWALFLCAVAVFARVTPERGGRLTLVGGLITALGAIGAVAADFGASIPQAAVTAGLDEQVSNSIDSAGFGTLLLLPTFLVSIGLLISAIGLLRAPLVPRWVGVVLVVGAFLASFAGIVGPVSNLVLLPVVIGFIGLARTSWSHR